MKYNIDITHELIITGAVEIYTKNLNIGKKIIKDFDKVDNVERINFGENDAIKVQGTKVLGGYKVENGGFFDVINMKYYKENELENQNFEIVNVNNPITSKQIRKLRKK